MKASKILAAGCVALASLAVSQTASARDFADIYTECGLGALIAPSNGAVAAVTNVTWDLGTTAVSSNVSSADTCAGGKDKAKKSAALIIQSYAQLEQDLARGQGEHLSALVSIAGCSAEARTAMTVGLRQDLAVRAAAPGYSSATRYEQAKGMFDGFAKQAAAASCSI